MEAIRTTVHTVAALLMLSAALEMLLPGGRMEKPVRLIMGLVVVISGLGTFLTQSMPERTAAFSYLADFAETDAYLEQGAALAGRLQAEATRIYAEDIAAQAAAFACTVHGVANARCEAEMEESGEIRRILLHLQPAAAKDDTILEHVCTVVAGIYQLEPEQIVCSWLEDDLWI